MVRVLRWLLRVPAPLVSREQALEIARRDFPPGDDGWTWEDPTVVEGLREWRVVSRRGQAPARWVCVCQQTGRVVDFVAPPR
ncbi:MAG TPA: hypothetical protein VGE52_09385 [Pirellulales bacterium]